MSDIAVKVSETHHVARAAERGLARRRHWSVGVRIGAGQHRGTDLLAGRFTTSVYTDIARP